MPLPMVPATAVPKTNAAMKFQKAAHATARNGVRTRVDTTVAMELAASCQPFENSNARVSAITLRRSEKLVTGASLACAEVEKRFLVRLRRTRNDGAAYIWHERSTWAALTVYADFRMTPSMTLATSSHLSTAVSMTSKISFHLMICTESFSSSKSCAIKVRQRRSESFS